MLLKRTFDLIVATVLVVAFSWLIVLVGVGVRLLIGRPVLFRQRRPGLLGRPFTILKFRTMSDARDRMGNLLPDEARLTWFGKLLRKTSLDELPSLFNVLGGAMSLVGPRPLLMEYLGRYSAEQMRRHEVLPGLTGLSQVRGRNALSWDEKLALDAWYAVHRTFWLDMKILAGTFAALLRFRNVSAPGHETTMPIFMGSSSSQQEPGRPH